MSGMYGKKIPAILLLLLFAALIFGAGCTGEKPTAVPAPAGPAPGHVPASHPSPAALPSSVNVKNTGAQEIHVWVAGDDTVWEGNSGNSLGPGKSTTLALTSPAPAGAAQYLCIGRSEKVLRCLELTSASLPPSGILVWDGTTFAGGS